jgi:hypothetical protein
VNAFPSPTDIVTRLRDYRSHRIYMRYPDRDGTLPERVDWNLTGAEPNTLMVEAAAEIERLRAKAYKDVQAMIAAGLQIRRLRDERNEARREVCEWVEMDGATTAKEEAELRGWNCYEQDNWPSTKDRSEPDAEPQSPEA